MRGRPRTHDEINWEFVTTMRKKRLNWVKIARLLKISTSTLRRRIKSDHYIDPLDKAVDAQVSALYSDFLARTDFRWVGIMQTSAFLKYENPHLYITRAQVIRAMKRVDPEAYDIRTRTRRIIARGPYIGNKGPHHWWHIDSWHKMIRWKFIVFGGVDGFTKKVMFLRCSNNNKAATHLRIFKRAVQGSMIPSRVRADRGKENVLVAQFMYQWRGLGRGSFVAGRSVHNTRIERFWGIMRMGCMEFYIQLFRYFERQRILNVDNPLEMFCLHYLFMNRINEELERFVMVRNHSKIRTSRNQSPYQMELLNMHLFPDPVEEDIDEEVDSDDEIDVDPEQNMTGVTLDPIHCPLTEEQFNLFQHHVIPITLEDPARELVQIVENAMEWVHQVSVMEL